MCHWLVGSTLEWVLGMAETSVVICESYCCIDNVQGTFGEINIFAKLYEVQNGIKVDRSVSFF